MRYDQDAQNDQNAQNDQDDDGDDDYEDSTLAHGNDVVSTFLGLKLILSRRENLEV